MVDTLTAVEVARIAEPMNLFDILAQQVDIRPLKEALIYGAERYSYGEVMNRSTSIAKQLRSRGVKKGDRIAVLFPNHPDYVASFFAVMGLGGTVVPINPLLRSEEIAHILSDSGAETLIVYESSLDEAMKSQEVKSSLKTILVSIEDGEPSEAITGATPHKPEREQPSARSRWIEKVPARHGNLWIEALSHERTAGQYFPREKHIDRDKDLALLVYTSGTTGKPKGAMLTHGNILAVFPRRLKMLEICERDRTLAVLPMCHIYGITVVMIGTLSTGGALAMLSRFEAPAALELIARERVTIVPAVPAMHRFMLMELERKAYDLSSVRLCLSGGSALPFDLHREIEERMGAACLEGYALTETACATTINPLHGQRKVGSVGPAMEGIEVRITDSHGEAMPAGDEHVGEVQVRGANIMLGYYKQPDATQEVISTDGWFSTGDLGYKDEDGYLFIVGRKKEMIIRGGQNIYPREIEDVLCRMPGIVEAAVFGVPDKFMGERVKAVVVSDLNEPPGEDEVKAFCAEYLAEYKVPRIVEFRDILPRNSTGKILKRLL